MKEKSMQRRDFLQYAGLLAGAALTATGANAADRPPNIVILLSDDQGWGDLGIHGNVNIKTPHIDSLARDGALLDRFFVCPVCAPTRAEFLTGRYYPRTGVHGVSTGAERMNPDEVCIADTFKAAGYATGAFGKWHNGTQWPYHPNARGFDEYCSPRKRSNSSRRIRGVRSSAISPIARPIRQCRCRTNIGTGTRTTPC